MYEPRGPLPREIYVRRRVAAGVLALVVLLVVGVALYLASRGGGTDTEDAAATGAPEPTPTSSAAAATTTTSGAAPTGDQASRGRCADQDLRLTVWPAEPNVAVGKSLRFFVTVENPSKTACDRDLAGAPLSFEVYRLDTNTKVWSSIDCTTPKGEDKVVLQPGKPVSRQIDWSGRRSAEGACSESDRTPVDVGFYQVYALVGKVFSPAATFNVVQG